MKAPTFLLALFLVLPLNVALAASSQSEPAWPHAAPAAPLDPIAQAEDQRQVDAPALATGATSPSAATRARVARAYGRIQKSDGITPLERLLKDAAPAVRAEAAFALGQFAWKAPFVAGREAEITAALTPLLSDAALAVRRVAVEAIGKIGLTQAPALVAPALADADAAIRAEGLMALFRYRFVLGLRDATQAPPALPATVLASVLALAKDASPPVRRNVAYDFARFSDARPGVTAALTALSADPSLWVRFFAVSALQKSADPAGAPAALKALADPAYEVRTAAVSALAALGALAQAPAATIATDRAWQVRAAYAAAVAGAPDVALTALDAFRADRSPSVRAAALDAVVAREKTGATAELERAAADPDFQLRAEAAADAAGIDEALALKAAKDPDVRVRSAAIQTLGTYPDAAAFAAIRAALASSEPAENGAAAAALEGREEPELTTVAWQAFQAWPGPQWSDLRTQLLAPLVDAKNAQTTAWLTQALQDPSGEVVAAAYTELQARAVPGLGPMPVRALTVSPYEGEKFARDPIVVLDTTKGRIEIRCFAKSAPTHVANFVGRARDGLYDGKSWHRVVANFVIQGGSSDGAGWGSPGYELRAEVNRVRYIRGTVGMPRTDDFDSGSDEIFITHVPTPHLDGQYTVFGQVIAGLPVIDSIEMGDVITRAWVR